jgi:hypothetical protein
MPYKIGNKTIPLDTPFTTEDGVQRPANWIRLATEEEKSAIGLVWEADVDMNFDNRFYWSKDLPKALEDKEEVDEDGNPLYVKVLDKTDPENPVMVDSDKRLITRGLKYQFIAQVKQTAGSILAQTDWMVTRKVERDVAIPAEVVAYRASVVAKADELEASISAVTSVEELASLDLSFPSME